MIVAAHKAADMPADLFYIPVQVGHALTSLDLGYQADDVGDNISELNASYCELTAVFWAWKNLHADVIGICHYRRFSRDRHSGHEEHASCPRSTPTRSWLGMT